MARGTIAGCIAALIALSACEQPPDPPWPASSCAPPTGGAVRGASSVGPVCVACAADPAKDPYAFAWQLFASLNRRALDADPSSNDTVWETWADDLDTFPSHPDPESPPRWPEGAHRPKVLRVPGLTRLLEGRRREAHASADPGATEEVRRNPPAFQYIADNGLYYKEGIEAAFGCAYRRGAPVAFPRSAIEVKAAWKPITADQAPRFHTSQDAEGRLVGLVALHVSSKVLPSWFWATFEHVDNPGRCDAIGCRDDFGADPAFVPSAPAACQPYAPGAPTPALLALFASLGLGSEWRFYRLKGVQTDFVDAAGQPTLLGNSVLEDGFVMTASCMTCHARAAMDHAGTFLPPFSQGSPPAGQVACGAKVLDAFNGAPSPGWYGDPPAYVRGDFVWALSDAQPAAESW